RIFECSGIGGQIMGGVSSLFANRVWLVFCFGSVLLLLFVIGFETFVPIDWIEIEKVVVDVIHDQVGQGASAQVGEDDNAHFVVGQHGKISVETIDAAIVPNVAMSAIGGDTPAKA